MKSYTAHLKPGREPVLVADAFSWGAFLFGPLWFAAQRAWIPAAFELLLLVVVIVALPPPASTIVQLAIGILAGLIGRDGVRWTLERRGYAMTHVLAARDEDAALARLLTYRPEIAAGMAAIVP